MEKGTLMKAMTRKRVLKYLKTKCKTTKELDERIHTFLVQLVEKCDVGHFDDEPTAAHDIAERIDAILAEATVAGHSINEAQGIVRVLCTDGSEVDFTRPRVTI